MELGIGVPPDEQWLEYARSTDKIWYYGGSGADDVITVDYVTEPGLLGDHHLITRLTENNGSFTFDAQVQLDFGATDSDGELIWDPQDIVYSVEQLRAVDDDDQQKLIALTVDLAQQILPPEGDYLAIVIDAKEGNDEIYVGPTVQRSVWVAAGDGDDRVEFSSGAAPLVDLADADRRNEVAGNAVDPARAFDLETIDRTTLYTGLTIDSPEDVDWFEVDFGTPPQSSGSIRVDSISRDEALTLELFRMSDDQLVLLGSGSVVDQGDAPFNPTLPARVELSLNRLANEILPGAAYFVRVLSSTSIPTQYDLAIDIGEGRPVGQTTVGLGVTSNSVLRRDVIVGGAGADVLMGGPSEDWVIGGSGNDVLSGGRDRGASDLIIGEEGDDLLQIIPDDLPVDGAGNALILTLADELEGGPGYDRVLYLGGDLDPLGRPVDDHVMLSYNAGLARYELTTLVWDWANEEFAGDQDGFFLREANFRTAGVEAIAIELRGGNDELHLEAGYNLPLPGGGVDKSRTFGISPGDRQSGGVALEFEIDGGAGNDRIFGSPYGDTIHAGSGIDLVLGYGGDDQIFGDSGDDLLIGGEAEDPVVLLDALETRFRDGAGISNDTILAQRGLI